MKIMQKNFAVHPLSLTWHVFNRSEKTISLQCSGPLKFETYTIRSVPCKDSIINCNILRLLMIA